MLDAPVRGKTIGSNVSSIVCRAVLRSNRVPDLPDRGCALGPAHSGWRTLPGPSSIGPSRCGHFCRSAGTDGQLHVVCCGSMAPMAALDGLGHPCDPGDFDASKLDNAIVCRTPALGAGDNGDAGLGRAGYVVLTAISATACQTTVSGIPGDSPLVFRNIHRWRSYRRCRRRSSRWTPVRGEDARQHSLMTAILTGLRSGGMSCFSRMEDAR